MREQHRRAWITLSNGAGDELVTKLVRSYMMRRQLPVSSELSVASFAPRENKPCLEQHDCEESSAADLCSGTDRRRQGGRREGESTPGSRFPELPLVDLETLLVFLDGKVPGNGLVVRPSIIPNAGRGLFAGRRFEEGELLCVYRGKRISLPALLKMTLKARDYVMGGFGLNCHLDAADRPDVLARYINDDFSRPGSSNVRFVKLKRHELAALVIATRDICAGEEIYASYGEGYWRARGIRTSTEQPSVGARSKVC